MPSNRHQVEYSRLYGPDRKKLDSQGADQGPSALSEPQNIKRQQPDVKQRVLVSGDFGDGWNQVARGAEVAALKARVARAESIGWQPIDHGTVSTSSTFTVNIPNGERYELLRMFARGDFVTSGAHLIGMRFNGASSSLYDYEASEIHNGALTQLAEEVNTSIPRIGQWDSSTACNFEVVIFAAGPSTTTPSYQSRVWRGFGSPALGFAAGEHKGGLTVNSLLFSMQGVNQFDHMRWAIEGYRLPTEDLLLF